MPCGTSEETGLPLMPTPERMPPDIDDIPPADIDDRLNDVRGDPSDEADRSENERLPLPGMRDGMNPPNRPANGMAGPLIDMPESKLVMAPPYPPREPRGFNPCARAGVSPHA